MKDLLRDAAAPATLTVSELNREARTLLERGIGKVRVEGELSNLARPASGHLYFTLKDDSAQIRCAYFRQRQRGPTISLKDGDQVTAHGRVSLYEARGDYQLIVEGLEAAGEGELRRRFELLKKKLAAEGLFDEELKRPLPLLPARIGVITSPSGAAVRDILTVLRRRFPAVPVVIYPAAVQGDAAVPELRAALATAIARNECDVIVIGRGGGSLEDLWAFNDEGLARDLRDSPIPVVSAVGHEVDFTIADFVADLRAPTPTAAAELIVPDQAEWRRSFDAAATRLAGLMRRQLQDRAQALDWLARRLAQGSPAATVARQSTRLQNARQRLRLAVTHSVSNQQRRLERGAARLLRQSPQTRVERNGWQLAALQERLVRATTRTLDALKHRITATDRALRTVSPQATLDRGYAIVSDAASGKVLSNAAGVTQGTQITARLARGSLAATVDRSEAAADDSE